MLGLAFLFGGFCFALGIMIRITRDGHETAIEVPEGSTTRVVADGQVEVALPGQKPAQAVRPITFRTAPITRGDLVQTVSATGTLEPEEVVDVGAKVTGQIISLGIDPSDPAHQKKIDYGAVVHKGTVLASIDDALYKARVAHSEAGLRRAEAELTVARAKQQPPDLAKATVIAAESVVQQSKADLEQAKTDLDHTVITSPVEGVIIDRRVNVGQTVVAGQNAPSLFLIAKDLRRVQICFDMELDGVLRDTERASNFLVAISRGENRNTSSSRDVSSIRGEFSASCAAASGAIQRPPS